jgi:hypothetical protein
MEVFFVLFFVAFPCDVIYNAKTSREIFCLRQGKKKTRWTHGVEEKKRHGKTQTREMDIGPESSRLRISGFGVRTSSDCPQKNNKPKKSCRTANCSNTHFIVFSILYAKMCFLSPFFHPNSFPNSC